MSRSPASTTSPETRHRRVHPRGPAGRPLRRSSSRPLRLRRVGFWRLPAWLLKDRDMVIRSKDPKFMHARAQLALRLGKEVAPLPNRQRRPHLTVQVENEYGSFGNDHEYMEQIHHDLIDAGFNKACSTPPTAPTKFPTERSPSCPRSSISAPGGASRTSTRYTSCGPTGPFMAGECWDGWFDHWGGPHDTTNAKAEAADLDWILRAGLSISIYMFHGGTSFGWMNGANYDNNPYRARRHQLRLRCAAR